MKLFKLTKFLLILAIFLIPLSGFFVLKSSMSMENNGVMSNCVFTVDRSEGCQMTISQHIAEWQQIFTLGSSSNQFLLLLTLLTAGTAFILLKELFPKSSYLENFYVRYKRENPDLKLFDYLLQAISRGILHSRIYA